MPRRAPGPSTALLLLLGGMLAALLLTPLVTAAGFYAYFQVFERILPGVSVSDSEGDSVGEVRLSGKSIEQAAVEVHKTWNMEHRLLISDGEQLLEVSPAQLGLSVDAWQTAFAAYQVGHGQPVLVELDQLVYSLENGWEIAPVVSYDPAAARAGLESISNQVGVAPKDAELRLEGRTLVAVPGEPGHTLDIETALAQLAADPRTVLLTGYLQVNRLPVPPRVADVSAAMSDAQRLLDTPLSIRAYDPVNNEWLDLPVSPDAIAAWLKIEPSPEGPRVEIDAGRVAEYLSGLGEGLDADRMINASRYAPSLVEALQTGAAPSLLVNHKATTYLIQPGDTLIKIAWKVGMPYWKLIQANPDLNPDALWTGQEIVVPSKDELLPLPVVINKRIVISISEQRLWTYQDGNLLGEHVISTGIDRSPTQPGVFQVQTHELNAYASVWDLHMPHFLGIYEAWPGFMNGIHGLPTLSSGRRLWANVLGRPASYGCIILNLEVAEWLYNWAENGVVVEIRP